MAIVTGSPGGSSIINYVAKTLIAIIDWGLDPQAASALPNFGSRNGPTELEADTRSPSSRPSCARSAPTCVVELTSGVQTIVRTATAGWAAPIRGAKEW